MGKLARFLKLERARPERGQGEHHEAGAGHSLRFDKIEPRHEVSAHKAADPFSPPPESETPIEIDESDDPGVAMGKQAKRARAEERLIKARQELLDTALVRQRLADGEKGALDRWLDTNRQLARLTDRGRVALLVGGTFGIALTAAIIGTFVWGLFPILLAVVAVSYFSREP